MVYLWQILRAHNSSIFPNYLPKEECHGALQLSLKHVLTALIDEVIMWPKVAHFLKIELIGSHKLSRHQTKFSFKTFTKKLFLPKFAQNEKEKHFSQPRS